MGNELITTNGGFDSLAIADTEAGTLANVAREESELKAAIFLARNFPRDEAKAYARLVRSCERPSFAAGAQYCFPRGGQDVKGPSIDLAREAARCWGNIRYGLRIVTMDEENVHIKGYAIDLESNTYVETEDKFARLIFRKKGGWVKPDERDLRELVNRRGAICVRNAILQVLPPDVVDAACKQSDETLKKSARGDLEAHRDDTVKTLAVAFDRMGISTEMLVQLLGHDLKLITAEELSKLRLIYKSLADGNTKPSDHFNYGDATQGDSPNSLASKMKAAKEAKGEAEKKAPSVGEQATAMLANQARAVFAEAGEQSADPMNQEGTHPTVKEGDVLQQTLVKKESQLKTGDQVLAEQGDPGAYKIQGKDSAYQGIPLKSEPIEVWIAYATSKEGQATLTAEDNKAIGKYRSAKQEAPEPGSFDE